ncbi:MAG: Methionine--tRNA ligase [Microgenomates bacterium OLB22]|nr:MAG: Methionine--tRNA ligase [Microgenomates bacterium OLB22]
MKKDPITFDQFTALDIRVGYIVDCQRVEGSEKLLLSTVDLGADYGTVTILSGIGPWFGPADLKGKKTAFLANLAPRPMMGHISQGMMLLVDAEDDTGKPLIMDLPSDSIPGQILR